MKNRRPPAAGEVAATEHQDKRPPRNDHFNQLLEKPCTNHGYLVNHKFKDCDMMKRLLRRIAKTDGYGRDKRSDTDQDKEKPAEGEFPDMKGAWSSSAAWRTSVPGDCRRCDSARYVLPRVLFPES